MGLSLVRTWTSGKEGRGSRRSSSPHLPLPSPSTSHPVKDPGGLRDRRISPVPTRPYPPCRRGRRSTRPGGIERSREWSSSVHLGQRLRPTLGPDPSPSRTVVRLKVQHRRPRPTPVQPTTSYEGDFGPFLVTDSGTLLKKSLPPDYSKES